MKNIKFNYIKLAKSYFANAYSTKTLMISTDAENLLAKDNRNNISSNKTILQPFKNPNKINSTKVLTSSNLNYNKKTTVNFKTTTGLQLLDSISKPASNWPGLIFLHKKGKSQTKPNYNLINYNFPYGAYINNEEKLVTPKYNVNKILIENIYKLLILFFKSMYCLISKPIFIFTQDTIKIQLFYFACITEHLSFKTTKGIDLIKGRREEGIDNISIFYDLFNNLTKVYPKRFNLMCGILSKFFNKPVELELIRLHKPYLDSNILINFLSLIINRRDLNKSINKVFRIRSLNTRFKANSTNSKSINIENITYLIENLKKLIKLNNVKDNLNTPSKNYNNNIMKKNLNIYPKTQLNSIDLVNNWFGLSNDNNYNPITQAFLTGINIKISGRLRREPIIPKVTTKKFEKGFTAKGKINYAQMARFTHKNRKGAFSITIKSGQNF